ncbi:rhomboid-like protein [Rhodococcus gordoniae]
MRRAPGTYIWLGVLLVTSVVTRRLPAGDLEVLLGNRSTDLHHPAEDPVRVLVSSAFRLAGGGWFTYFVVYTVFHVPAERWLGTFRWLCVVVTAHVGATYLSEGALYWAIRRGDAPASAVDTLDYGVSYALAGVVAVSTYRIARPWCSFYLAAVLAFYAVPLFVDLTFTAVGHFIAALLGRGCCPLVRSCPGTWSPVAAVRRMRTARPGAALDRPGRVGGRGSGGDSDRTSHG